MDNSQRSDYNALCRIDPTLTEAEYLSFKYPKLYRWDLENEETLRKKLRQLRRDSHLERELEQYDISVRNTSNWRCFSAGEEKWRRKDGSPLTEKDIEYLREIRRGGQVTKFRGEVGDEFITLLWVRDSSD